MDTREKLLGIGEKLDGRLLVGDGAVGTLLADHEIEQPPNKANLTHIRSVHEEYPRAGARAIEPNTFLANRLELAANGQEEKVRELNIEGIRLAREAVDSLPPGEDPPKYGVEVAQNLLTEAKLLVGGDVIGPIV